MEKNLPKGWELADIGDIYSFIGGGTPSKSNQSYWGGEVPWASIKDISKVDVLVKTKDMITKEGLENSSSNIAQIGDVIIGTRMNVGKPVITEVETAINQDLKVVKSELPGKFTYYWFKSLSPVFESLSSGTTVKGIRVDVMKGVKFPLPPLAEQKRIVAKLDSLFASLENTKTRLEKIPTLLKNFKQAILTQAVTGKLTEQWREGKELEELDIVNLGSLLEGVKYGTSKKSDYHIDGVPILRIPNIKYGEVNVEDLKYSILDNNELDKLNLKEGDVLIIRSNGSVSIVGKTAVVRKEHISYSFAGYLVRLRPGNGLDGEYLNYALQSNYLRAQIVEKARSTSGVNNINTQEIKELLFPIFSIQEQIEIVCRVESLFAKVDAIESQYQSLKKKIDTLPQAILAKAFRGELVAQNPLDEPASVLLEKIKVLRNAEVKAKPKRKVTRKKKIKVAEQVDMSIAAEPKVNYN